MGQGGAAILLAARGPRCAASNRDLPTVTQPWRGGRGGLPVPSPWERGTAHPSLPIFTRSGRWKAGLAGVGGAGVGETT